MSFLIRRFRRRLRRAVRRAWNWCVGPEPALLLDAKWVVCTRCRHPIKLSGEQSAWGRNYDGRDYLFCHTCWPLAEQITLQRVEWANRFVRRAASAIQN